MGTHCLATQEATVTMKFLAVLSTALACASAQFGYAGYPYAAAHAAPIAAVHSIPVAAAPLAAPEVTSSQFRAEDEAGNTAYGYQNINNAAQQRGNAYGGVEGSYSFVDQAGRHTVSYIADDLGYRITGRSKRSAQIAYAGAALPTAVAGYAAGAAPSRQAILTTINLNPGHAVFYRVD